MLLTQELGNFAHALEGRETVTEGQEVLLATVRDYVLERPNTQILGTSLTKDSTLPDVEASLCRQMGLPSDFGLRDIKNRVAGSENKFILVFPGAQNLSKRERK